MTKRLCLFAGYDHEGKIDDYVVYYLKELSEISDVYYQGDFEAEKDELKKISKYTKASYANRHKKYDFGSWSELVKKIGLDKIREYDELILANDSCYGPLFSLEDLFKEMDERKSDFWGLSCSRGYHIHIQSFFLVFKKNVIKDDTLFNFLDKVKPEASLGDVCTNYEERVAYLLTKKGFKFSTYIPYGDYVNQPYYNTTNAITNKHFPLLKVKTFYGEVGREPIKDWEKLIKDNSDYDVNLIKQNLYRRGFTDEKIYAKLYLGKRKGKKAIIKDAVKGVVKGTAKIVSTPLRRYVHKFVDYRLEDVVNSYNYRIDELEQEVARLSNEISSLNAKTSSKEVRVKDSKYTITNSKLSKYNDYFMKDDFFMIKEPGNIMLCFDNYGKDILFLGNMYEINIAIFNTKKNKLIIANSVNVTEGSTLYDNCYYDIKDLENFKVEDNNKEVYLDLVFVEPFTASVSADTKKNIFINIYNKMIDESIVFVCVKEKDKDDMLDLLNDLGYLTCEDAIKMYDERITAKKGYTVLFLRKTRENDLINK